MHISQVRRQSIHYCQQWLIQSRVADSCDYNLYLN